jgi:cysteate synthase
LNKNGSWPATSTSAEARHYALVCISCGRRQHDDGTTLECPSDHTPSLLTTEYVNRKFTPRQDQHGLFRYQDWLPVSRTYQNAGRTAVYRSQGLGKALGLPNLWIAFNGYWPERGAFLATGTFKEFEAYTVLGRLPARGVTLTVASSGNTGAAFAWVCSEAGSPCLLIVPGKGLRRFKFRAALHPCVNLVSIDDGDYPDAIELAANVSRALPFQAEGGIKNVGRRDGLATVLLSAFEEMRCLPSHYFQAVGSGTGAIAVLEAARRVCAATGDMTGGMTLPRLMLCQNLPFTPIYDAWRLNLTAVADNAAESFREAISKVYADELTNWAPPYQIRGGVYDSLTESRGDVLVADNSSTEVARQMFLELEGIDIEPAAGVAVSCLRDAAAQGTVGKESVVLLNITGGGRLRLARDYPLVSPEPKLRLTRKSLAREDTMHMIAAHCASVP